MASNSGFTDLLPSNTSSVALGDDDFRSTKSFMKNWWQQEHYALDGSANSAGVHKAGSARAFSQSAAPTAVLPVGQLWHDTDDDALYVAEAAGTGSWTTLIAPNSSSNGTLGPPRAYVRFSDQNTASSTSALALRFGTPQGYELAGDWIASRAGAITGIAAAFGANITAGSLEINPAINRAPSVYSTTMDSSTASNPIGSAGHSLSETTNTSTLTFASGDWISCYVAGDASLSPSGSGDVQSISLELTYVD